LLPLLPFVILHRQASGVKLRVELESSPVTQSMPMALTLDNSYSTTVNKITDYAGNIIYENNILKMILVDGGYIENNQYHFYLSDHLVNNRVVANATGTPVQKNHYYPFGMAFAETLATEQGKQPYKFGGKELDQMHGLNHYDFSARYNDGVRFTTVDPRAEDFYNWSPYMYSYNNPIRFIDPDGEGPGNIILGFVKGYNKAVLSANMPISSNSTIGRLVGVVNTVSSYIDASPEQRATMEKDMLTAAHEQTTLGLIESGVTEYKTGGDGS